MMESRWDSFAKSPASDPVIFCRAFFAEHEGNLFYPPTHRCNRLWCQFLLVIQNSQVWLKFWGLGSRKTNFCKFGAEQSIQTHYPFIFMIVIQKNNRTVSSPSAKTHHPVELDFKWTYDWRNSLTRAADSLNHSFRWMHNLARDRQRNMQVSDGTQFSPQAMHLPNRISKFADLLCCVIIGEDGEN